MSLALIGGGRRAGAAVPDASPDAVGSGRRLELSGPEAPGRGGPADGQAGPWRSLSRSRELRVLVLLVALVSLVIAGTFQVALPTLAHARFGPAGDGALLACFGVGSLAGTLLAAKLGGMRLPGQVTGAGLLAGAIAVVVVPFLGGLPGAAAAVLIFGAGANFGNVTMITVLQRWAPARLLGRAMSLVMLASMGTFPVAVAASGFIVRAIGPTPFFPVAGAVLTAAVAMALSQRAFREFGAAPEPALAEVGRA